MAAEDTQGSVYVPLDNWVYPALDRLHALGYVDTAYLGLRPWTRTSIAHMLELSADRIETDRKNDEARSIFTALVREFGSDIDRSNSGDAARRAQLESAYTQFRGIGGTPLHDSFHLGQSIVDDYGRPYENGFNNSSGFSARASAGRFSLYFRGETQYAPSAAGYSPALAAQLLNQIDSIADSGNSVFATIPEGPIAATGKLRVMEAALSYHLLGHEISFDKNDHWLGPDKGASMLWGNNAENIYEFQINRIEPLRVPGLSSIIGPLRYDFFVGGLHGHTLIPNPAAATDPTQATSTPDEPNVINPGNPWVHMEKIGFKPTRDLEFGFSRLVVWGGEGHAPITIHTFLHSFFSFQNVAGNQKPGRTKKRKRRSWISPRHLRFRLRRLPYLSHWITLYTDSLVRRRCRTQLARHGVPASILESISRDFPASNISICVGGGQHGHTKHLIQSGQFLYWEQIPSTRAPRTTASCLAIRWEHQGKGGQAWLFSPITSRRRNRRAFQYRNAKAANAFIRAAPRR